ncbi:hypothetical protein [Singulisphaera sp. PoT]|uniref:hypothetical protein n=1 Tax=Singulisphaera sp. PoT TaxID=3411797 RepID=UPI003BF48AB8
MNASFHEPITPDDRWIDRLVDGELSPAERAELLKTLDASPDGWRRCALAFLEAQAWRSAMQPSVASSSFDTHPWEETPEEIQTSRPPRILKLPTQAAALLRTVALAACLFLAFAMGRMGGERTPSASVPVVMQEVHSSLTSNPSRGESAPKPAVLKTGVEDVAPDRVEVDPKWLATIPNPVPEHVLRQLQRRGYEVEQHEAVLTMPLGDGQRVHVPVDEFQVRYVGDNSL